MSETVLQPGEFTPDYEGTKLRLGLEGIRMTINRALRSLREENFHDCYAYTKEAADVLVYLVYVADTLDLISTHDYFESSRNELPVNPQREIGTDAGDSGQGGGDPGRPAPDQH